MQQPPSGPPAPTSSGSLCTPTLVAVVDDLRAKRVTSVEVTERVLDAAERQSHLDAFTVIDRAGAMAAARLADRTLIRGPLHGVPLVIKDNIHVAGLTNAAGTGAFEGFIPDADAPSVRMLRHAGAFIMGKTRLHELAFGATSDSSAAGPIHNAVDTSRCAGGSSGGTAVAVASGSAIAGLGTDTGGSVRIPASLNGIVAFRPTTGRYPSGGTTPVSKTRDTVGPMTRTVADAALLDAVLAGDKPARPALTPSLDGLILGIGGTYFTHPLHPGTDLVWQRTLQMLQHAGVILIPVRTDGFEQVEPLIGMPISLYEARVELAEYARGNLGLDLTAVIDGISSPDVHAVMADAIAHDAPNAVPIATYHDALRRRRLLQTQYQQIFADNGVPAIIFPTTPLPAAPIPVGPEVDLNGQLLPTFLTYIRNTGPGSIAGIPGLTIPAGRTTNNLPVGFGLDAPAGSDRELLAIGTLLEEILVNA